MTDRRPPKPSAVARLHSRAAAVLDLAPALVILLLLALTGALASAQTVPAACSVFAGPPSTPVHVGTFAGGGGGIFNRYQTTVVLHPNPAAADHASLLANSYWIKTFNLAEVSAGGAFNVTFDLPCYTVQCLGSKFFPPQTPVTLTCWMGGQCSGASCELYSEPFTIPSLITSQPASQSICSGSATFSVDVAAPSGMPPGSPAYQWHTVEPSGSIAGATGPTYTTSVAGSYRVHVSYGSECGEWSDIVTLSTGSNPSTSFGSGVPGSGGLVPALGQSGCGAPGTTLSIDVTDGLGGAPGLLLLGFSPTDDPHVPAFCGQLLVSSLLSIPVTLGGPSGVAGAGALSLPLSVPASPSFAGIDLYFQYGALDPGACAGVSISKGLMLTLN